MSTDNQSSSPKCFNTTIEHPRFNHALQQLLELVRQKSSTRIAIVTGPTGAGKTTLHQRFAGELSARAAPELQKNPEAVAYGGCAIKARGSSSFSWKDPYIQMLRSLRHPFAEARTVTQGKTSSVVADQILTSISPDAARSYTNDRLFRILQKTIEHRKPQAMLLDEAHHFLRVGSAMTLVDQLEHIKFIADETQTLFVLFGTYELIELMDLSGALIRRREVVHLPRYIFDPKMGEASLEDFAEVVAVFVRDLSDDCEVELLKRVPYLYQGSVGCVGVLRDWVHRAYIRAQSSKGRRITREILKDTEFAVRDRDTLLTEALKGEKYFADRELNEDKYLARLGLLAKSETTKAKESDEARKDTSKPFERKPHNDPTGPGVLDPNNQEKAA